MFGPSTGIELNNSNNVSGFGLYQNYPMLNTKIFTMKFLSFLILPILSIIFISCNKGDPQPLSVFITSNSFGGIYSVNLDGSNLKVINHGYDFSLLSNGKIIYIYNKKLYSCNSDGTDSVIISPKNIDINHYQLNSNTTKILFIGYSYSFYYSMNIDGSGFSQSYYPFIREIYNEITLSPDGQKLAYATPSGIYIVNTDGSNQRQIQDSTNTVTFLDIQFTPDGNNVVYLQDFRNGKAQDLRLYNVNSKIDTSLFYSTNGNWVTTYSISKWNTLLFIQGNGIYLMSLNDYNYTFLHSGKDAHFSFDSTKITFISNYSVNAIDLKDYSTKDIQVFFSENGLSNPLLSFDGKQLIFQVDTSWIVNQRKNSNNNIVY